MKQGENPARFHTRRPLVAIIRNDTIKTKKMIDRIKFLFKPFILALVGLIVVYTFLNWLLFIELELFVLKKIIPNFIIPFVIAGVLAWIIIRPKFKILNLEASRGNWRDFYSFILWIMLSIPLIISQEYIVTATGKLTELNTINEITQTELSKYYVLKDYYIDKNSIGVHSSFDVSGKHNDNFNMHIYISLPILEKLSDIDNIVEPIACLGIEYKKTISNKLEPERKEKEYQKFANISQKDFDEKDVSQFIYLDRISHSDEREGFIESMQKNPDYSASSIILVPVNEPFESRNGKKLSWIIGMSIFGSIVWLFMIFIPKIDEKNLIRIKAGKPDKTAQKELKEFIEFLLPKDGYFITPILIYINIGIFIIMSISGLGFISFKGQDLLNWGANYGPLTENGEWWRLLTSTFLHGGLMHLLANMYGLLFVGIFLEPLLGRVKYLAVYLLTGIFASIASLWWHEVSVISVGASGAIFGLYGTFLSLIITKVFPPEFGKAFLSSTLIFVGFNLLYGLTGGIDNAAHIGGLICGLSAGLILLPILKIKNVKET